MDSKAAVGISASIKPWLAFFSVVTPTPSCTAAACSVMSK